MPNNAIWADEETFTNLPADGSETKGTVFNTRSRAFIGVAITQFVQADFTTFSIKFDVSWDKRQWYTLRDSAGDAAITLTADVNNVSPVDSDEGQFHPAKSGATTGIACPAPYVRLSLSGAGSPTPVAASVATLRLVAWG